MGVVSNLVVKITAETAGLRAGLADVNESVQGFAAKAGAIFGALELGRFAAEIGGAVSHTNELASHIQDLAEKSGISAEAVQALDFAAKQSGSSFDSISTGLAILSKHLVNIGTDTKAQAALKDLGLSAADFKGLSLDQIFIKIGAAIAQIPDPIRQSNDALVLLGRGGADNLPTLKSDLAGLTQQARDMGLVISNDLITKGDELNDTWTAMQTKVQALKAQGLTPLFDAFLVLPPQMQASLAVGMDMLPMLGSLGLAFAGLAPMLAPAVAAVGGLTLALGGLAAIIAAPFVIKFAVEGLTQAQKAAIDSGVVISGGGEMVIPLDAGPGGGPKRTTNIDLPSSPASTGLTQMFDVNFEAINRAYEAQQRYQQGIDTLTARLGGGDTITAARQWASAVNAIGGEEKLATEELRQYHNALSAAADKMALLGKEAPAYWRLIANEQRQAALVAQTTGALGTQLAQAVHAGSPQLLIPTIENQQTRDLLNNPANVPGAPGTKEGGLGAQIGAEMAGQSYGAQFAVGVKDSLQTMPQAILAAFQGGGSVVKSIFSKLGGDLGSDFTESFTKKLSSFLPSKLAGSIGSLLGPLGALLGPAIGGLVAKLGGSILHGIQGMFGTDEEARSVNPARDAFSAQFRQKFGVSDNTTAVIKALEGAGLGGERAAALIAQFNSADTMTEFNAAKAAIEEALSGATKANETFNMSLTGSDEAIKELGQTEMKVSEMMLQGFSQIVNKLDEMIAKLSMAGALAAQVTAAGAAVAALPTAGGITFSTPGEIVGTAPSPQDFGVAGGPQVTIQAGTIVGNPDDLAYMVIDAIEGGGDVASDYRAVHNQVMES